jgi:hypothetical protein
MKFTLISMVSLINTTVRHLSPFHPPPKVLPTDEIVERNNINIVLDDVLFEL